MRLATIASALAIVLCVAVFGAIFLQRVSIPVPAREPAPPQTTPTEGQPPGSVVSVTDSAAESAVAAPAAASQASPTSAAQAAPYPPVIPTSCSNPNALGISRVVEIDTTGGPGFGFEHFKAHENTAIASRPAHQLVQGVRLPRQRVTVFAYPRSKSEKRKIILRTPTKQ